MDFYCVCSIIQPRFYCVCLNIQPRYTPLNKAIVMRHISLKKNIWISLTCGHLSFIRFCGKDLVSCKKFVQTVCVCIIYTTKYPQSIRFWLQASRLSLYYVTSLCNSFKIIWLKCFLLIFRIISVLFSERFDKAYNCFSF